MQLDTMGEYVRRRLERWGEEFALSRDCEYLGHQSKNMLQVLIEHKGEMPARAVGFKPLETDREAQEIEDIVCDIARDQMRIAQVLRAYYCGSGRRKVERFEQANNLLESVGIVRISLRTYLAWHELGVQTVRGALIGMARAA